MRRYYITDRKLAGGIEPLLGLIARNLEAGIDMLQIREKDLSPRELVALVRRALKLPNPHGTAILVNERLDVAMAARADGVHLPSYSLPVDRIRNVVPRPFLVGVSCHSIPELKIAEQQGADFAVFGPVFSPLSKVDARPVTGLDGLRAAASTLELPIYALGGITAANASACIDAGAAGIAGITLFQSP